MRKLLAIAAGLCLFVACTPDEGGGPTDSGEPATIRFQFAGEAEEVAVYEAMVQAFENDNPNVRVKMVPIAEKDDHLTKLATAFSGGSPPDLFLVNFREYSQFVAMGGIEPVGPHIEHTDLNIDDYYPQPIEAFTYDGTLQCMPQNISSLVVYLNEELFKRADVKQPRPGWTWDDFRQTALDLTGGKVDGLGIDPEIIRIAPFVWGNGGEIVDDLESPTRFTLDEPAAREAVEFIVSLVRDDEVVPTEDEVAAQDLETRFVTGKLAMLLSSRRDTPAFREVQGLDWDVAPLPQGKEPAGILHSDAYCMATGADLDASLAFIEFALGQQGQTITALGGRTVPSLKSVADSPAFLDPTQEPDHPEVFLDAIPVIRRTPVTPTWPEVEAIAEEILTRAFYDDGYDVDRAIQELDEQTRDEFEEGSAG